MLCTCLRTRILLLNSFISGTVADIAEEIYMNRQNFFVQQVRELEAVGCDRTNVNMGVNNTIIQRLELQVGHTV